MQKFTTKDYTRSRKERLKAKQGHNACTFRCSFSSHVVMKQHLKTNVHHSGYFFFYEKKKNEDGQDNETAKRDLSSPWSNSAFWEHAHYVISFILSVLIVLFFFLFIGSEEQGYLSVLLVLKTLCVGVKRRWKRSEEGSRPITVTEPTHKPHGLTHTKKINPVTEIGLVIALFLGFLCC